MPASKRFASYDGTEIAYHVVGAGKPLIVIPGGPARPSAYLGDIGGLGRSRQLILMDIRGTGESATPEDVATYRADRVADDVAALVDHLGLESVDVLGHSAGASTAVFFAIGSRARLRRLVLLTPSARVLGIPMIGFEQAWDARKDESWYADAIAADEALDALPEDADPAERDRQLMLVSPFFYGRWDRAAQSHAASNPPVEAVATGYYRDLPTDTVARRTELGAMTAPTLIIAGELDAMPTPATAAKIAELFPNCSVVTIPGGGHFPWLDDADAIASAIESFLAG